VREDYSPHGSAWEHLSHDHARSKAYRWGEDGIAGLSDNHQRLCLGLSLWNGQDPILKERLFGLSGNEGNHGEDVKEAYFYVDSTPTHSYMKYLYKYPQSAFPDGELVQVNGRRTRTEPEYELLDTDAFADNRYFDVFVEYAKIDVDDILMRITVFNRGPEAARLHLLPTIWFRNTWQSDPTVARPDMAEVDCSDGISAIECRHETLGRRWLFCAGNPRLLFTENETNRQLLYGEADRTPYVKDAFHRFVVHGEEHAVNGEQVGTKAAAHYTESIDAGEGEISLLLRLTDRVPSDPLGPETIKTLDLRKAEADEFYDSIASDSCSADARNVQRQALAGLLWTKQFYHYDVGTWLREDEEGKPLPDDHERRNRGWKHLYNEDVISMPDKWEYPWYASWDLAFHCIPLALVDAEFAKEQLLLFLREWYMHPNGQIPAYEWAFDDVTPPVHAWAVWRVYKIEKRIHGTADRAFLERAFHKLLLNFTWWVNQKDAAGNNIFEGGFLGLDNIGVFDRSAPLPTGGLIEQSDGTSWMGMFCLNMLAISLELAREDRAYADIASKFFEHFVYISDAMNNLGDENLQLWD